MDSGSILVIKVKYGDTLRRFNATLLGNEQLALNMDGLREKIIDLFSFSPMADINLTYVDEDGDVVTLVDDEDLLDVMRQRLKVLRIDVHLNDEKFSSSPARSSGSSTTRIPGIHLPVPCTNSAVTEILKSVQEPLREAISDVSIDLASKAATSSPVLAELVEYVSKIGQLFLNQVAAGSGPSRNHLAPSATVEPNNAKNSDVLEASKSTLTGSTSTSTQKSVIGKGKAPTGVSAPVDLNLKPPCDSNHSRSTATLFGHVFSKSPTGHGWEAVKEGDDNLKTELVSSPDSKRNSLKQTSKVPKHHVKPSIGCPFNRTQLSNDPAVQLNGYSRNNPIRRNPNLSAKFGVLHKGIQCDGCGVHPITGPRFKSKVKVDYDLCSFCVMQVGNLTDYIRLDMPPSAPQFYNPDAMLPTGEGFNLFPRLRKLSSHFIQDVNVSDGTVMAPCTPFTKIWRMQNNGTLVWPQGLQFVWIGGDQLANLACVGLEIPVGGVPIHGTFDIAVSFTAPELPGTYISYWKMSSPSGELFGQRVWVLIEVDLSLNKPNCDKFQGLSLNMSPECSIPKGLEGLDINVKPHVDGKPLDSNSSKSTIEQFKPMADEQREKEELNFPINDTLLVGHGVSPLVPSLAPQSSAVSYPIIDSSDPVPVNDNNLAKSSKADVPSSSEETDKDDLFQQFLLKELEEMGFLQVDVNKELLRIYKNDLEPTVDALCQISDWDPMLAELKEMGFLDFKTNNKLLKKYNGSLKRVIMDLIAEEKP